MRIYSGFYQKGYKKLLRSEYDAQIGFDGCVYDEDGNIM